MPSEQVFVTESFGVEVVDQNGRRKDRHGNVIALDHNHSHTEAANATDTVDATVTKYTGNP